MMLNLSQFNEKNYFYSENQFIDLSYTKFNVSMKNLWSFKLIMTEVRTVGSIPMETN